MCVCVGGGFEAGNQKNNSVKQIGNLLPMQKFREVGVGMTSFPGVAGGQGQGLEC